MASNTEILDAIVIGGGIMGSWTTAELLKAGLSKVVMIEKFPLPHTRGSSHGATRICRFPYPQLHQTILARDALDGWMWLQEQAKKTLIRKVPLIWTADEKNAWEVDASNESMISYCSDLDFEKIDTEDKIRVEFPNFDFSSVFNCGLIDRDAYVLMADQCLGTLRTWILSNGGVINDGVQIRAVSPGEIVSVETSTGENLRARSLIVCAGAWSKPLLQAMGIPENRLPLTVKKIPVVYFREKEGMHHPRASMIHTSEKYPCLWSIPSIEYPRMVKFGPHYGPEVDPDMRDAVSADQSVRSISDFIANTCLALDPTPAIVETCMYTVTPDEVCILDRHPEHRNIAFGCGFSGAGFKLGPSIGRIFSAWALGKETSYDLSDMRSDRFS